jgi:hypothetical protein
MIGYVTLGSNNIENLAKFYDALFSVIGAKRIVDTFNNFIVKLNSGVNPENYTSVIVWCESFGEFITAAKYR